MKREAVLCKGKRAAQSSCAPVGGEQWKYSARGRVVIGLLRKVRTVTKVLKKY